MAGVYPHLGAGVIENLRQIHRIELVRSRLGFKSRPDLWYCSVVENLREMHKVELVRSWLSFKSRPFGESHPSPLVAWLLWYFTVATEGSVASRDLGPCRVGDTAGGRLLRHVCVKYHQTPHEKILFGNSPDFSGYIHKFCKV
jgi:hypothetical protein